MMRLTLGLAAALALTACANGSKSGVDDAAVARADKDGANWLSYGRTHDEQRFSPLTSINEGNVGQLGLTWFADLDSQRGQEATPIVVDGTMYVSTAWSMVKAYDATNGKPLWSYDPEVPRETLVRACCDAVNRGVAVWHDKVYVATLDGRLIALDARTGKVAWEVWTVPKGGDYTITGAPRIVKGRVVIGNGGAEYRARGSIAAYDAATGKRVWRFFTVPGDPSKPFEQPELAAAAKTWDAKGKWWQYGGGGTVWDSITYDPETDLLYFGTGNGEPWNASIRSPEGGDNLFTSSIVAVNPDTGKYVWHFQETPGDRWDFDSNQQIIAATIPVDGKPRRVLLHAPKNGFFYVLDARTGKFLSGKPFAPVNWATGLDPVSGKPDVVPAALYDKTGVPFVSVPGAAGAHSWQPMSYSPKTGLVYIPANQAGFPFAAAGKDWKPMPIGFNTAQDSASVAMPADAKARGGALAATTGSLVAWDPVKQRPAWTVPQAGPSNGGILATAGNLVFQGTAAGTFVAYSADAGKQLWSTPTQTGVIAAPMTYSVNGEQYVAIMAGWGGVWDIATGVLAGKSGTTRNISRLLVFKLGGKATLPAAPPLSAMTLDPPPVTGTPAQIASGARHYGRYCGVCHGDAGVAGGLNPDLRHSGMINKASDFHAIVIEGALKTNGMVSFAAALSPADAEAIRHYLIKRANEDKALEATAGPVKTSTR
jgi:quinohemoprotein ethanol dehydrogenase